MTTRHPRALPSAAAPEERAQPLCPLIRGAPILVFRAPGHDLCVLWGLMPSLSASEGLAGYWPQRHPSALRPDRARALALIEQIDPNYHRAPDEWLERHPLADAFPRGHRRVPQNFSDTLERLDLVGVWA